jgi:ABC-2 type transport system ATP-binding protein
VLSSHLLTEVESIVQRILILRRGNLALNRTMSELEVEPIILVEVRGPSDQVVGLLRNTEGVSQVAVEATLDGVTAYQVRTSPFRDVREQLAKRLIEKGWPLRRLDLRRRSLQDRWNEINNMDEAQLRKMAAPAPSVSPSHTAVKTG